MEGRERKVAKALALQSGDIRVHVASHENFEHWVVLICCHVSLEEMTAGRKPGA